MSYKRDVPLEALGKQVISDCMPDLKDVRIAYMKCDKPKKNGKKIVLADCEKLSDKVSELTGIDFVITFYADAEGLTMVGHRILMQHELLHIGWDGEHKSIVQHDVDEFRWIIEKYGLDWQKEADA